MKERATLTSKKSRRAPTDSDSSSPTSNGRAEVEPASRHALIATEAYLLAARRGFVPGYELDDWLAAEANLDATLSDAQKRLTAI